MGIVDLINKLQPTGLTEKNRKWNKLWDLWAEGLVASPYMELMNYHGEVNNGGHEQYFSNTEDNGDLQKEMAALETILSEKLKRNLRKAYQTYLDMVEVGEGEMVLFVETDEETDEVTYEYLEDTMEECDKVFFENEQEIICTLEAAAARIKL